MSRVVRNKNRKGKAHTISQTCVVLGVLVSEKGCQCAETGAGESIWAREGVPVARDAWLGLERGPSGSRHVAGARKGVPVGPDVWLGLERGSQWLETRA
jgi:hypothetical protein